MKDLERLWRHLHNGNGPFEFVMGFRDKATGAKRYARSKKWPVERAISWALSTVKGGKTPEGSLAFVPYSTNAQQMSRWGGFDFDAHDGDAARAYRLAFEAFRHLLNCESATILESSGSGGWHVWAISSCFKPAAHWIRLLKGIARDIGVRIESGICEIFPPDTLTRGLGKGLRAPGAWNPGTNTLSEVLYQNADDLIAGLPPCVSGKSRPIGQVVGADTGAFPIEKKTSLSLLSFCDIGKLIGGVESLRIDKRATRREKLKGLTGTAFHQVSRIVAEQMARAQFAERTVETHADEAEHLQEFTELWEGLEQRWHESITEGERTAFAQLSTDAERSAFRIVRSYARKAAQDRKADFPIARDNLGERVGLTGSGAGLLRDKLDRLGIISKTADYRPNKAATRFRWLLAPQD
jgi:hypothetical protein